MKILVIQTAFIGDVILATPLLRTLHSLYPGAKIDVLVRKGNENLLENFPGISRILIWDKGKSKFSHLFSLLKIIRAEKYDKVYNLQRFASTGILTAFSAADEKIGFKKNPLSFLFNRKIEHRLKSGLHETGRNLNLLGIAEITTAPRPELFPSESDYEKVSTLQQQGYVCIAPASVWFTKQVPEIKWSELINGLLKDHPEIRIMLIGGPGDQKLCEELILKISYPGNLVNLAGKLSFLQTAALMKGAKMNFVNDSAPMHIASAMNANVTAFFCSTVPSFGFGPLSDKSRIFEVEGLACRPCGLHGHSSCPKGHFKCAMKLDMLSAADLNYLNQ